MMIESFRMLIDSFGKELNVTKAIRERAIKRKRIYYKRNYTLRRNYIVQLFNASVMEKDTNENLLLLGGTQG